METSPSETSLSLSLPGPKPHLKRLPEREVVHGVLFYCSLHTSCTQAHYADVKDEEEVTICPWWRFSVRGEQLRLRFPLALLPAWSALYAWLTFAVRRARRFTAKFRSALDVKRRHCRAVGAAGRTVRAPTAPGPHYHVHAQQKAFAPWRHRAGLLRLRGRIGRLRDDRRPITVRDAQRCNNTLGRPFRTHAVRAHSARYYLTLPTAAITCHPLTARWNICRSCSSAFSRLSWFVSCLTRYLRVVGFVDCSSSLAISLVFVVVQIHFELVL